MHASLLAITAALALAGPTGDGSVVLTNDGQVQAIHVVDVPAEEAGVLVALNAQEGDQVAEGDLLGQIKDTKALAALRVAKKDADVAQKEAENKVDEEYAAAQAAVAHAILEMNQDANRRGKKHVVSAADIRRLELEARRADLQIDQAKHKTEVNVLSHAAKSAAVDAAQDDIDRRKILAPLAGEIVKVHQKRGQWLNPGDPIVQVVDLGTLRVSASLSSKEFDQHEIVDRQVNVIVELKSGPAVFKGRVVFVDPKVDYSAHTFFVLAEVENRREKNRWVLLPGHRVTVELADAAAPDAEEMAAKEKTEQE